MKALYGLLATGLLAGIAIWALGNSANSYQVEPGPITPPSDVYDPVRAGEETPEGFRQLLPRDAIRPIYNPTFIGAGESTWDDDTLVIGVSLGGEAKAYPVSFLSSREMVIDWIGGTPVLVSW